jgi:hypothetical protein
MAVQCTGVQLVGGFQHEHVANLRWCQDGTKNAGICSREQMVTLLEKGGTAYVRDAFGNVAFLGVRTSPDGEKYVQTHSEKIWTDNLLALPHF